MAARAASHSAFVSATTPATSEHARDAGDGVAGRAGGLSQVREHAGRDPVGRGRAFDVVEGAGDHRVRPPLPRAALVGRDEFGAEVAEVVAERDRRPERGAVAHAAGEDERAVPERGTARANANGLAQPVWPPAPAQQHEAVGPRRGRAGACFIDATSTYTSMPASCSGPMTGSGSPTLVITSATSCATNST